MSTLDDLRKTKEFLQRGWTKRFAAIDENGTSVLPTSPDACKWCLLGAIRAATGDGAGPETAAYDALINAGGVKDSPFYLMDFNDHPDRIVDDVIDLVDTAIANELLKTVKA